MPIQFRRILRLRRIPFLLLLTTLLVTAALAHDPRPPRPKGGSSP